MPSGCTATFTVTYTQKTGSLQVMDKFQATHNHKLDPELYAHYPKHRKLTETQKETITDYLECNPTNAGLLQTVQKRFGKAWTLSDLKNFKQKGTTC